LPDGALTAAAVDALARRAADLALLAGAGLLALLIAGGALLAAAGHDAVLRAALVGVVAAHVEVAALLLATAATSAGAAALARATRRATRSVNTDLVAAGFQDAAAIVGPTGFGPALAAALTLARTALTGIAAADHHDHDGHLNRFPTRAGNDRDVSRGARSA
jgi:hypothetical protein